MAYEAAAEESYAYEAATEESYEVASEAHIREPVADPRLAHATAASPRVLLSPRELASSCAPTNSSTTTTPRYGLAGGAHNVVESDFALPSLWGVDGGGRQVEVDAEEEAAGIPAFYMIEASSPLAVICVWACTYACAYACECACACACPYPCPCVNQVSCVCACVFMSCMPTKEEMPLAVFCFAVVCCCACLVRR